MRERRRDDRGEELCFKRRRRARGGVFKSFKSSGEYILLYNELICIYIYTFNTYISVYNIQSDNWSVTETVEPVNSTGRG